MDFEKAYIKMLGAAGAALEKLAEIPVNIVEVLAAREILVKAIDETDEHTNEPTEAVDEPEEESL